MKSYYYVNLIDTDNVRFEGDTFIIDLQGRSFKSVKVFSGVVSLSTHTFNPALRLHSYTSNGFSSDRKQPVICLFNDVYEVSGSDWRYNHGESPTYYISETLQHLIFSFTDGAGNVLPPISTQMELILELEESE